MQDAWLGMLSGLAKFEGRSSLRTWVFTILVNRARSRGAREASRFPSHRWAPRMSGRQMSGLPVLAGRRH